MPEGLQGEGRPPFQEKGHGFLGRGTAHTCTSVGFMISSSTIGVARCRSRSICSGRDGLYTVPLEPSCEAAPATSPASLWPPALPSDETSTAASSKTHPLHMDACRA